MFGQRNFSQGGATSIVGMEPVYATSIQAITSRITDTNGPKGGEDTRCIVSVKLAAAGEVVVQGKGENILTVQSLCLSRGERAVSRRLDRRRDTPIR